MNITAVTGGTVVTPTGLARTAVHIDDGKIAAAGDHPGGGQHLDASGCYVLPGGVDPHCHLMAGAGPATAAAARGGTTTVLSFTSPAAGERDPDALLRNRSELDRDGAAVDVGLHAVIYDPAQLSHDDLVAVKRAGAAAIKIFLAYPELGIMCSTRRLYELMSAAAGLGLLVQVHCENAPLIDALVAGAVGAGGPRAGPRIFADTRPPEVEEEAVARTLATASLAGAACYLVHLSTAGAVDQVRLARKRGQPPVFAEVCVHHLLFDDARYAGADAERYLVAPPLRERARRGALGRAGRRHDRHRRVRPLPGQVHDHRAAWPRLATGTGTGSPEPGPGCRRCCPRPRPGACPSSAWCSSRRRTRRGPSATTRPRARSPPGPTPTS